MLRDLDHLVLAGPDLGEAVAWFADLTGVAPVPGGSHPGWGTANYLVDLGASAYLEIIGPDPERPAPDQPRPFAIDELTAPRIVTWALRTTDIAGLVGRSRAAGHDPGEPMAMSRHTADGELLEWRLTSPRVEDDEGIVPFLIDWGATPHPTSRGLPEAPLLEFAARHPDPAAVRPALAAVGAELEPELGELVALTAVVVGVNGPVRL